MNEEFFFPQNVRTSYRLWLMGPRHLRRLAGAVPIGLMVGWMLHRMPLVVVAAGVVLVLSGYVAAACLPLLGDDLTLWDVGREIRRHRRQQTWFPSMRDEEVFDDVG